MTHRGWALLLLKAAVLAAAVLILTARIAGGVWHTTAWPGPFVDWRTYEHAVERVLDGGSLYAAEQLAGPYRLTDVVLTGYAYPPASIALFLPFVGHPLGLAGWLTLNLGLLLCGIWAIVTRGFPGARSFVFAAAIAGLAFYRPFVDGVIAANVNVAVAGLVAFVAVGLNPRAAGVVGGIASVVKVFPGVVVLGARSKRASLATAAVTIGAAILLTLPLVGPTAWLDFVRALAAAVPDCSSTNQSIACMAAPYVGVAGGSVVGIALGGIAGVAMLAVRQPLALAVLASIAIMAPASNLHSHYWIIGYVIGLAMVAAALGWMQRTFRRGMPRHGAKREHPLAPTPFDGAPA